MLSTAVSKEIHKNIGGLRNFPPVKEIAEHILQNNMQKGIEKTRYCNDKAITDHYAIIPTGQGFNNLKNLSVTAARTYEIIVRRFLSIFYPPAIYQKVSITSDVKNEKLYASFKVLVDEGYLSVAKNSFAKARKAVEHLCEMGANVIPIFSFNAQTCDTRFGSAKEYVEGICEITGNEGIRSICAAEPIGPNNFLDIMVIAPCTGNTAAKLTGGIVDTPVLMAAKAHMRNGKPLVIAISTNDALGAGFKNIGMLMNMKNIYFVPFGQDNYKSKPNSMVAKMELLPETIEAALQGKQIQPVLQEP